ncbi:helix-turn-helix domain-containing protein [soil metagenome]
MTTAVGLLADASTIAAALDPLRRHMLALLDVPDSATGLAKRLGVSRQRVNYHVRALEAAGLVELVEERRRRGATERMVRRTADRLVVDPGALASAPDDDDQRSRVGTMAVVGASADAIRGVTAAAAAADASGRRLVTAATATTIRVRSPAALRSLLADLAATLARHDTGGGGEGLALRVSTLVWPSPAQEKEQQ